MAPKIRSKHCIDVSRDAKEALDKRGVPCIDLCANVCHSNLIIHE